MASDPDWHDRIPPGLRAWAQVPRRVRYARVGNAGPFELPRAVLEETWGEPELTPEGVCFRRTTRDVTGAPRVVEDACVRYGPRGLEDIGTYDGDGTLRTWDPPQRVLPPDPAPGEEWSATHTRGETTSERSVVLQACPDHPGCLVSVAETRREDGAMVLRVHYAEGEGFLTYEALIQSPGRPSIKTWTEALTVETRPEPPPGP
jgi:hypothetical protein